MKVTNRTLFILMVIFTILNLCDVVTTIFIIEGESNPIFNMFGGLWIAVILKFLIVGIIWLMVLRNLYPTNMSYYMLIAILVYGSLALLLAQVININGALHPEVLQQAASTPISERTNSYFIFMNVIYLIPILMSLLTFWIYDRSYKTVTINKEISKKNKWKIWPTKR